MVSVLHYHGLEAYHEDTQAMEVPERLSLERVPSSYTKLSARQHITSSSSQHDPFFDPN